VNSKWNSNKTSTATTNKLYKSCNRKVIATYSETK